MQRRVTVPAIVSWRARLSRSMSSCENDSLYRLWVKRDARYVGILARHRGAPQVGEVALQIVRRADGGEKTRMVAGTKRAPSELTAAS